MKILLLVLKRSIKRILMEMAWNRDDTWTALCYEEDIKKLTKEIDELLG